MCSAAERVVVVGVGNVLGGDDAAGLLVARRVRELAPGLDVREHEGDPTALLEMLTGARHAVLIDAVRSGRSPGTVRCFDVSRAPLPVALRGSTSTHAVGLAEVIELARALGRLPEQTVVYAIEGRRFAAGAEPTADVAAAVDGVAERIAESVGRRSAGGAFPPMPERP